MYRPGWNVCARKLKESAGFWHRLWCECGCPSSGVLSQIKRNTKARYKYEVRRLRRRQQHIRREKMGSALSQARSRDFWKEVRKAMKSDGGPQNKPSSGDGETSDDSISNIFASKLNQLLNLNPDSLPRDTLLSKLNNVIDTSDISAMVISPSMVSEALAHIKRGRNDGSGLASDHFVYASSAIGPFLSDLFTCMLRHSYVPHVLRDCILQPILKPTKDPSISDSYRPIAHAPTLSKVFEWCILIKFSDSFSTSNLQFGFKQGHSTDLCTGLIKNVIAKYVVNGSKVYGCLLDASKAFDRVDHSVLLRNSLTSSCLLLWLDFFLCGTASKESKLKESFLSQAALVSPMECAKVVF